MPRLARERAGADVRGAMLGPYRENPTRHGSHTRHSGHAGKSVDQGRTARDSSLNNHRDDHWLAAMLCIDPFSDHPADALGQLVGVLGASPEGLFHFLKHL